VTDKPSAAARAWDAAALVLVVGGAAVYAQAANGMHSLLGPQPRVPVVGSANVERWVHYRTLSHLGLGLVTAGVLVGVAAFVRSRREIAALAAPSLDAPSGLVPNAPTDVPPG